MGAPEGASVQYILLLYTHLTKEEHALLIYAKDTIQQLRKLLNTVRKSDCVMLAGDFNCQLRRNVPGKWCMTTRPDDGHEEQILVLIREYDLFAVDTIFKPKTKMWDDKLRVCNVTYRSKQAKKRPRKLDYICLCLKQMEVANDKCRGKVGAIHT